MIEVKLYGFLGRMFGKVHRFDIQSPAEAIRALMANYGPRFTEALRIYQPGFRVLRGEEAITEEELYLVGDPRPIGIVPVIQGAGGVGRIIAGVVLVIIGIAIPALAALIPAGIGLIVGGIVELIMSPNPPDKTGKAENKQSYDFDGPVNTARAGYPVPIGYGKLLVGGAVISAGIEVETRKLV